MIHFKCSNCSADLQSPSSMIGQEETCPQCGQVCVVSEPDESEQVGVVSQAEETERVGDVSQAEGSERVGDVSQAEESEQVADVSQVEESEQVADVSQAEECEQAPVVSKAGGRRTLHVALGVALAVAVIGVAVVLLLLEPATTGKTQSHRSTPPTSLTECLADRRLFNAETVEVFLTLARDHPEAFAGEVYVTGRTVDVGTQDMFAGFNILATWKRLSGFRGSSQASLSKTGGEKTLHAQAGTLPEPLLRQEVTASRIREILGPSTGVRNIDWVGEVKTYYGGAIGFVGTGMWIDGPKFIAAAKK